MPIQIKLISDADMDAVADVLKERIGHSLGNTDPKFLKTFLSERFSALACDNPGDYLKYLDRPDEFRKVLDGLTVPETFFYRFEAQLEAFKNTLLPTLFKGPRAISSKLKIWSAGCCTGEEPFTLALIAAELGVLDRLEILATDINPTYLERAAKPHFTERSVARVPKNILSAYFTKMEKGWALQPEIFQRVTFRPLNLNDNSFPSPTNGTAGCHLIFCRNVLIYFSQEKATEIINRLGNCLVPGGYLALGHAEFNFTPKELELRRVDSAFFFHKADKTLAVPANPIKASEKRTMTVITPKPTNVPTIEMVKQLAEAGKIDEAIHLCQEISSADPLYSEIYFFEGFLTRENPARSTDLFKKALYLEPNHLLARLELARCLELESRPADAIREYRELLRQANEKDPNEPIPSGAGITVGLLVILCQRALNKIEKQAA